MSSNMTPEIKRSLRHSDCASTFPKSVRPLAASYCAAERGKALLMDAGISSSPSPFLEL